MRSDRVGAPEGADAARKGLRHEVARLPPQAISEIFEYGRRFEGVVPMWFGESDLPTPPEIGAAAVAALERGETFYEPQSGRDDLRGAIAGLESRLHGRPVGQDRVTVTASGMTAIHIALQAICGTGDNAVLIVPLWPNAEGCVRLMGAEPRRVSLAPDARGRWRLDLDRLFAACDARTRAIFVNSPANPTGWMCSREEQAAILDFARRRGIWIIADEVYKRLVYDGEVAPSFLDLAEPDDLVFTVGSFSKSWAMTGWRLGWLVAPASLAGTLGAIVQYTNSNSPGFVQAAGRVAIEQAEPFVAQFRTYCAAGRDLTCTALGAVERVRIAPPDAAFYAFFAVDGERDSMALAKRLVRDARVGVAPGISFGGESEGWLRLCFARNPQTLRPALTAIAAALR